MINSMKHYSLFVGQFLLCICLMLAIAMLLKTPSNKMEFKIQNAKLPKASLDNNLLSISNIRDFSYDKNRNIIEENYIDMQYPVNTLKQVWFGISHFDDFGLAHTFLSFEFEPQQYLAVSIEARLTKANGGYNPINGLFRQYTKFILLGTERDIIGLRNDIRHESVYLYPLKLSNIEQQALLLNVMKKVDSLNHKPEFYNTLTDNCLTGLLNLAFDEPSLPWWMHWQLLLPGYSDELALEHDLLNVNNKAINEARKTALVASSSSHVNHRVFSQQIRKNYQ